MTRRIQVLPDDLVNRIAAGEVVERPFSVVKELVENSLDAGASRVSVELSGGGKEWIQVTDDGAGMAPDDLAISLTRHATSKLASADDLDAIGTLGFRGEALPSIASVARMAIVSRPPDREVGFRIDVEGGRVIARSEAGAPLGTRVEVSDLFFNTPARRAFLKADGTELRHVADWMQRLALARPSVAFSLVHDGRVLLEAPTAANLADRALAVLGRDVARSLFQVDGVEGEAALHGLVAKPGITRPSAGALYVDLNGRVIRDRGVIHAVVSGYGSLNPSGKYPVVVLHLEVPLDAVDVNVHPAKTEVRFRDASGIHRLVHHAIRDALRVAPWAGREGEGTPAAVAVMPSGEPAGWGGVPVSGVVSGDEPASVPPSSAGDRSFSRFVGHELPGWTLRESPHGSAAPATHPLDPRGPGRAAEPPLVAGAAGYFGQLRPIAQLHRTYLVCESASGLVLVDQHAAHERVTFERLRGQYLAGAVSAQDLLLPEPVDVGPIRARVAEERAAVLERLGYVLEPFGVGTVLVKRVPALLVRNGDASGLLDDLLEPDGPLVGEGAASTEDAALEEVLGRMACHGSVRAGRALSIEEMRELLRALDRTDFRGNCPHGRHVLLELSLAEIERRVGRR